MRRHRPLAPRRTTTRAALALLAMVLAAPSLHAQVVDTLAIRTHTMVLAHDSLEGRGTGTPGGVRAARYITNQLRELGIPGAGPEGEYLQPLPLQEVRLDTTRSRLIVLDIIGSDRIGDTADPGTGTASGTRDRGEAHGASFRAGQDFIIARSAYSAYRDFSGPAIFAGTAGLAHDALAEIDDLTGRIIVVLGTLGREALRLVPDWSRRGVAGVILLVPDTEQFRSVAATYGPTRLALDTEVDNPVWQPTLPMVIAGPRVARALLAGAPLAPDALDGEKPFRALPLARQAEITLRVDSRAVPSANIAALIQGHDPELAGEVVVYTAHFDHLGIGIPDQRGDSIYNGFSDNAAGTAMLLALADALRHEPPARSILFLFFTGEELGLLGSSYYVTSPLVPLERVAAVINLDAGAPPAPPRNWRIAGGKASTLGETARRVAARHGWDAEPTDASPNSDHWPFLYQGVPAIFIIPGREWEGVSRAEQEALLHRWEHYHRPSDHWHPEFPFTGLQRYAEIALRIGLEVANDRERPVILPVKDRK